MKVICHAFRMTRRFISKRLLVGRREQKSVTIPVKTQVIEGSRYKWIDLQNPQRDDIEKLSEQFGFHALNVEDCMAKFELPKLDSYDDHFFAILSFPPLAEKGDLRYSQLSMFVGCDYIVTVHQGDLQPLNELVRTCQEKDKGGKQLPDRSVGFLVHEIVDVLVDDLLHMSRKIIANLEDLEDQVFDDTKSVARDISLLRREINKLRRMIMPLKKLIDGISRDVKRFEAASSLELYFDDVIDHIDKVVETLEESRETIEIYKDTDFMLSTEKTNKVLAVLTIIFTLAIPATVIGTFYGMNVALPGAVSNPQDYSAFIVIVLASAVPAAVMAIYFRRLGWV